MRKFFQSRIIRIIGALLALILLFIAVCYVIYRPAKNPIWAINYSPDQAAYLDHDPEVLLQRILTDLRPQKIRLVAYWENLEPQPGKFDFSKTDRLLDIAEQGNTKVLLVIGHKQPRWPECHHPAWYEHLSVEQQRTALTGMLEVVVNHFKGRAVVERWQLENEPLFDFGLRCPVLPLVDLQEEAALVRKLDSRPIVMTDSGEKGDWFRAARYADVFGSTMYRTVHQSRSNKYVTYPIPPEFYRIRAGMLKFWPGANEVIGVELQAEPWFMQDPHDMPLSRQNELMNAAIFKDNVNYAARTGLAEHYLWGVEWWYWLNDNKGEPEMVNVAKEFFNQR
jgi:hypothetical protein